MRFRNVILAFFVILILYFLLKSDCNVQQKRELVKESLKWPINKKPIVSQEMLSKKCEEGRWILLPTMEYFYGDNYNSYDKNLATSLLAIAFNVEISNCSNMGPLPSMKDFDISVPIIGKSFLGIDRMIGYFFYSNAKNVAILSFTGTFYIDEWIMDSEMAQVEATALHNYKSGVLIHKGFYSIYSSVIDTIWKLLSKMKTPKVFITGHSLGGAMATVCAYDLAQFNPVVYSFASPRVFNPAGADAFNSLVPRSFRVFNTEDIVTTIPPPLPVQSKDGYYEHVNNGFSITNNLNEIWYNHTYVYLKYYNLAAKGWIPPA